MLFRKPRLSLIDGGCLARIVLVAFAVASFGACLAITIDRLEAPPTSSRLDAPVVRINGLSTASVAPLDYRLKPIRLKSAACPIKGAADAADHAACICLEQRGIAVQALRGIECWKELPPGSPFSHELMWELVTEPE